MSKTPGSIWSKLFASSIVLLFGFAILTRTVPAFSRVDSLIHLPLISRYRPIDLSIASVEVTQAIQTELNEVPLVASRPTIVRVYAQVNMDVPVDNVIVSLSASRQGLPLPGSPLTIGPRAIPRAPSRADYTSSFNFSLPETWLSDQIDLVATVDSDNTIVETDEYNNDFSLDLDFIEVPPLKVTIVPINYTNSRSGNFCPAPTEDWISDWILKVYPVGTVQLSWHPPVDYVSDLGNIDELVALLSYLTTLKLSEGAPPSEVYYGFIPFLTEDEQDHCYVAVGGLGWLDERVSAGIAYEEPYGDAGVIAIHEIGHNFGRMHAPCGGPANIDPNYPYPNGDIGQYGLDVGLGIIKPPNYNDFMGYCWFDVWVSDYTYEGLLQDQLVNGRQSPQPPTETFLIRISLDQDEEVVILPIYAITTSPSAAVSSDDYRIELIDSASNLLASYPVAVSTTEGDLFQAIQAAIPKPNEDVASVRLVRSGKKLVERSLESRDRLTTKAEFDYNPNVSTLHWAPSDIPALVRYSNDGGRSWTTLGLDIVGGNLSINTDALKQGSGIFEITLADINANNAYVEINAP